jgi:hypothetical protein
MIRPVDSMEFGALRTPPFRAPLLSAQPAPQDSTRGETAEQEITRLTWAVLDRSASLADRQRLAELVDAQHSMRRR